LTETMTTRLESREGYCAYAATEPSRIGAELIGYARQPTTSN
jgi:hypothetical protein